jgi:hypothetical protein
MVMMTVLPLLSISGIFVRRFMTDKKTFPGSQAPAWEPKHTELKTG